MVADPDFNLGSSGTALYSKVPVFNPGTSLGVQGFTFDDAHLRLYTLQCSDAPAGDLYLSWLDLRSNAKRTTEHMTLLGFDHGQQFGVTPAGTSTYIWTSCDAVLATNNIGYGSKICRFTWAPGKTLASESAPELTKYDFRPGSTGNIVSIDNSNNRLLHGYTLGGVPYFALYELSDVLTHGVNAVPLGPPIQRRNPTSAQGLTLFGDYIYYTSGAAKSPICSAAPPSYLAFQNIWDGDIGSASNTTAIDIPRREPEGIAVQAVGNSHRLVWSYATKKDCTGSGEWLQSWYYLNDTSLTSAPSILGATSRSTGGPLGCGSYRVYAYDRGGSDRIGEITPIQSLTWNRVRDDISNAVINTVGFGPDCCEMLASLRSMRHELVIFRDGVRVWEGPITRIAYQADQVVVEARDVMQYVYRRIFRLGYDHRYKAGPKDPHTGKPTYILYPHGEAVINTVQLVLNSVLKSGHVPVPDDPHEPEEFTFGYDPNILKYIHYYPHTKPGDAHEARKVYPFQMTAWELIDDLAANSGIDYTVLGRSIMVWDTSYPIGKTDVLDDSAFMANPIVTEYGMSFATFSAVTDGNGYYGVYGGMDSYYGMVEILASSYTSTVAPDKTAYKSWQQVQKTRNAYIEAFSTYHSYNCLSSAEQARLARYYRERYTKGVMPARQKVLDALIKPLAKRVQNCSTLKTRLTKRYNEWQAANKSYNKYQEQMNRYITTLSGQAQRNMSGRRTVLTDQKTGATLKNKAGKVLNGGAPVVVRIPDNTQLNPSVMLGINDLVPGIWIPLRSTATCQQLQQWQKLDNVSVSYDETGMESVQVTMSLAPNGGQDFDAIPAPETEDDGTDV